MAGAPRIHLLETAHRAAGPPPVPGRRPAVCEQVPPPLTATVPPQWGRRTWRMETWSFRVTPAMAFRGRKRSRPIRFRQTTSISVPPERHGRGAAPRSMPRRDAGPGASSGAEFPLLDACPTSNPSCDQSTFPFFDGTLSEKRKAGSRRVARSPTSHFFESAARAVHPQRRLKKVDFTTEFVMYLVATFRPISWHSAR